MAIFRQSSATKLTRKSKQNKPRKLLRGFAFHLSGGHGVRRSRFRQRQSSIGFAPKLVLLLVVALFWLVPVVSDCLASFGNQSSTISAQLASVGSVASTVPSQHGGSSDVWAATFVPMKPSRRRLRIVIYARYSTEEQHESSIADQIKYCRKCLEELGVTDVEIIEISDAEMSGELRNRPGIDQIWSGVEKPEWDMLVCEDAGRLFRNASACIELIEIAVDSGMRAVCFNDDVDTTKEGWQDRLRDAAEHHAKANYYTRKRIKRKITALWEQGAAVGKLRPGYLRTPTIPATVGEPAEGPFFDSVDPTWVQVLNTAFERIADGKPTWLVGRYLKDQGLPGFKDAATKQLAKRTIGLIRQTLYRGVERYGIQVSQKKLRSGESKQIRNETCKIKTRDMPHLRIVPDVLWYRANAKISARVTPSEHGCGDEHPLFGIPRDSRGPLSNLFFCVCDHKMYQDGGRQDGSYRCGNSRRNHICWNKASASRKLVHQRLGRAVCDAIFSMADAVSPLVEYVTALYTDDSQRSTCVNQLAADERRLLQQQRRLLTLATSTDTPPESLLTDLNRIELELAETRAEIEEARRELQEFRPEVTREAVETALRESADQILNMDCEVGPLLQRLIPNKIRAVPYLQFGSTNVVLRAEFSMELVNLLPQNLRAALGGNVVDFANARWLAPIPISIDLFTIPEVPANAMRAVSLYEDAGLTLDELAAELGMTRRQAHRAKDLGKAMRAAGITDPYIRLTAPPQAAAHWRTHASAKVDGGDIEAA
jgi:DNA invertase Pin-like site-specific DNA recombinase